MESLKPGKELIKWECPICLQVPSKEVFSCSNGHSICSLCIAKVKTCPTCRVQVSGLSKQRNFGLEELLDLIQLKCCWDGCKKKFSRSLLSEHEEQCCRNPYGVKLCHFMRYTKCNFQFTLASMTDDEKFQRVIQHLRSCHEFVRERRFKLDTLYTAMISIRPLELPTRNPARKYRHGNYFPKQMIVLKQDDNRHLFLRVARIYMNDAGEEMLSILFVQLTPDFSGEEKLTFNLSIKCFAKEETASDWGPYCAPSISWRINPMKIDQFIEFNKRSKSEQCSFPFPMPISHLEKHYSYGNKGIKFTYHIEVD